MSDFRLKAFYSVARNLSFTKASQELFVSQPAVTKHVRELESLYGVRLFDRKGNSISLTEAGKLLMEHCERILDDYRKLEYDMHQLNNEYAGELRLGASTTISQYVLPPVLAAFTERYPKMSVSLMDTIRAMWRRLCRSIPLMWVWWRECSVCPACATTRSCAMNWCR